MNKISRILCIVLASFLIIGVVFVGGTSLSMDTRMEPVPQDTPADVPTWGIGSSWSYEQTLWFNSTDDWVYLEEEFTYTVTAIEYVEYKGEIHLCYNLTLEGEVLEGLARVEDQYNVNINEGTIEGYMHRRVSDLGMVTDYQYRHIQGRLAAFPLVRANAWLEFTRYFEPVVEDFDFPLSLDSMFWGNTTMKLEGYYAYRAMGYFEDEEFFDEEEEFDQVNNIPNFHVPVITPIGTYSTFYIDNQASQDGVPVGYADLWYSPDVQYIIKDRTYLEFDMLEEGDTLTWFRDMIYYNLEPIHGTLSVEPDVAKIGDIVTVTGYFPNHPDTDFDIFIGDLIDGVGEWTARTDGSGNFAEDIIVPHVKDNTPTLHDYSSSGIVAYATGNTNILAVTTLTVLPLETYELTVNIEGEGTVDVDPDLPAYEEGTEVNLTVIPANGWEFLEWTGDVTGTDLEVTITMDDDKMVTAVFAKIPPTTYNLTVNIDGEGTVDVDPDLPEYDHGTVVSLTATAATGWEFVEWTGDAIGTDFEVNITMDENKTVTAVFEEVPEHNYTLTVNVEGEGSVDIDPDLPEYEHGTPVNLTAIPPSGWKFVEWTGDATGTELSVTITMDENKTVTAVFEEIPEHNYTLTVNVEGEGSVDLDPVLPDYKYGTSVNLTAIPASGWEFVEWTGDATGTDLEVTITMDGNKTVTAVFEEEPVQMYTLTINTEGQGNTDPAAGTHDYDEGTNVTITATPATGWQFVEWAGDATGTDLSVTITMDGNKTITAVFEEIPVQTYTLTINIEGQGTTDPAAGTHEFDDGESVTITATPASGWEFIRWEGDATGASPSTSVTMDDDMTVTAVFEELPPPTYTLTIVVDGDGTTDPAAGTHGYHEGTTVTITATPATGWEFIRWEGDATGTSPSTSVTMDADMTVTAVFEEIPPPTYTLTIVVEGEGTTDPAAGTHDYDDGESVPITATPDDGWEFVEWIGDATGTDLSVTITMDDDVTVTAVFAEIPTPTYTLTVNIEGQGTTDPAEGTHTYDEGTDVTITATPADGWEFVEWTGAATGTDLEITVTMDDDKTVNAVFVEETIPTPTYTLTVDTDGEGVVTVSPEGTEFEEGTTVTLTAIPTEGWTFVRWEGGASGTSVSTSVTMENDITVTAVFERDDEKPSESGFLEDYWWVLLIIIIVVVVLVILVAKQGKQEPEDIYEESEDEYLDEDFDEMDMA